MRHRTDIQGLRAVAVLVVLLFHAGVPMLDGGYVGVDVFFVVSGYLITSLLVGERGSTGRVSLAGFYSRRARRILPMACLVAVATLVASWVWLEPLRLGPLATDVLAVASFSSNLVFGARGSDYLQAGQPPSPLQHYWSLGVEEQFYLVWPLLVAAACWGAMTRRDVARRVALLAGAVSVASFGACMAVMGSSQPWAFFSPHTRAFELSLGALVAVLPAVGDGIDRTISVVGAWVGLATIAVTVLVFDEGTRFPGPWALVPVAATVLLLRGGESGDRSPVVLLRWRPLQWLGSRSYSAYLWHWPVLIVAGAALSRDLTVTEGLACVMAALALSEVSYRLVENPIRRDPSFDGVKALSLATALITIMMGAGVLAVNNEPVLAGGGDAATPTLTGSTTTTITGGDPAQGATSTTAGTGPTTTAGTGPATTLAAGVTTTSELPSTPPRLPGEGSPLEAIVRAARTRDLPANLTPSLAAVKKDQPSIYDDGCHASFSATKARDCVYGDPASAVVVGLYGDSHAAQWFPAFEKIAVARKWRLITYTKRGCPPAELPTYNNILEKVYTQCEPWRQDVLRKMARDKVSVVFVANFDRVRSSVTKELFTQWEWRNAMRGTVDAIRRIGVVPVLMEDTPFPDDDIPTCLSANVNDVGRCAPQTRIAYRAQMTEVRRRLASAGVASVWVRNWFCTTSVCPPVVGNVLVYRDDDHMTVAYAELLAPLLDGAIGTFVEWHASRAGSIGG